MIPFIRFTFNKRYILRWMVPGLFIYIPVLNFFSIGYLSRTSRILLIGDLGLPPWQDRTGTWFEGLTMIFVFILYEPFFLFFSGFFFTSLGSFFSVLGSLVVKVSYVFLFVFSFFLPFAFAIYSESHEIRQALAFERIWRGIKPVFLPYAFGYIISLCFLYIGKALFRIPYLFGFVLSSLAVYYVLLLSTYYFTHLYRRTDLTQEPSGRPTTP